MNKVREFAEEMMKRMRFILEQDDQPIPMIFRVGQDWKTNLLVVAVELRGPEAKDALAEVLKTLLADPGARYVILLADAYTATVKTNQTVDLTNGVKGLAGRTESIVCSVYGKENDSEVGVWKYDRDAKGKPKFGKIVWKKDDGEEGGRFNPENIVGKRTA